MQLDFQTRLLHNAMQFATIGNEKLPPHLSAAEMFSILDQRTEKSRTLMEETNGIIETHLTPILQNPQALTDEEADAYTALADKLYSQAQMIDMGLAEAIHEALLVRARARADIPRTVHHLYWLGYINIRRGAYFADGAEIYFREATGYLDQYFTIDDKPTRMLLNRCLGNMYVAISGRRVNSDDYADFFAAIDNARWFWTDPKVRALDPDFPWDAFVQNSHQNTCSWADRLRTTLAGDRYLAERVYRSAEALYGQEDFFESADGGLWPSSRTVYMISAAKYHLGVIDAREITENMRRLFDECKPGDYSQDGIFRMMHVSIYLLEYMRKIKNIPQQRLRAEEKRVSTRVLAYCKNLPEDADRYAINRAMAYFAPGMLRESDMRKTIDTMLMFTAFSHMPTRVHSAITAKTMRTIAAYFLRREPKRFIGIQGTETEEQVLAKQSDILMEVEVAGLSHDIGKLNHISTIATVSRAITEKERAVIQTHTEVGYGIIRDALPNGMTADVLRGHHKWYNGQGGYPENFDNTASPYRFIIDIAAVADSIDAATDGMGRSYTRQLTLDEVIQEIHQQAGTRYSPDIAAALDDPTLRGAIKKIITADREKAYYDAYLDNYAKPVEAS